MTALADVGWDSTLKFIYRAVKNVTVALKSSQPNLQSYSILNPGPAILASPEMILMLLPSDAIKNVTTQMAGVMTTSIDAQYVTFRWDA